MSDVNDQRRCVAKRENKVEQNHKKIEMKNGKRNEIQACRRDKREIVRCN